MSAHELSPEFQPDGKNSKELLLKYYDVLLKEGNIEYNWTFIDKDKNLFHTEANLVSFKQKDLQVVVALFRNKTQEVKDANKIKLQLTELSEHKVKMEKYIESNMQLENFAYMASHDLKTPLRNIVSFSQLLEKSLSNKLSNEEQEYLNFIKAGAKNMNALISGLFHYAKCEYNELKKVKINLHRLLSDVIENLKDEKKQYQAIIKTETLPKYIIADKEGLYQLFYQLIKNAIFFKQEFKKPVIDITYIESTTKHQFNVQDNGIGIEADYFDQIFLLFKKLNAAENFSSSGVGLALCKKIVEQQNGAIWLDSELNKGSTFSFTIEKL